MRPHFTLAAFVIILLIIAGAFAVAIYSLSGGS